MTRGNGTRGTAKAAPKHSSRNRLSNSAILHCSRYGTETARPSGHVLHAHGEVALVVGIADTAGALIDVGHVLQDLGGALAVGHRGVVAVCPQRILVVVR